eukprot:943458-Prymnesium_polylepis.1
MPTAPTGQRWAGRSPVSKRCPPLPETASRATWTARVLRKGSHFTRLLARAARRAFMTWATRLALVCRYELRAVAEKSGLTVYRGGRADRAVRSSRAAGDTRAQKHSKVLIRRTTTVLLWERFKSCGQYHTVGTWLAEPQ